MKNIISLFVNRLILWHIDKCYDTQRCSYYISRLLVKDAITQQAQTSLQPVLDVRFSLASLSRHCLIVMFFFNVILISLPTSLQYIYNQIYTDQKHVVNWLKLCCQLVGIRLYTDVIFYVFITSWWNFTYLSKCCLENGLLVYVCIISLLYI